MSLYKQQLRRFAREIVKPCKHKESCTSQKRLLTNNPLPGDVVKVGVLGVPMHFGQGKPGVRNGPKAIRDAGLLQRLSDHVGLEVNDYGDLDIAHGAHVDDVSKDGNWTIKNSRACGTANKKLADAVYNTLQTNDICVNLGGDHSMAVGSIFGHSQARPNLSVLWVDAHPDLNNPTTSPSGNIHGMPLHFLLKDLENKRTPISDFDWCKSCVSSPNIGFIAIRDIDPGEIAIMKRYNIPHCSIREIDRNGIAHCMEKILDMINPSGNRPLHVSFDIDSVDPGIAPSTGTPVRGGLSYREAMYVTEEVARTGSLSAFDLVEVNPELDPKRAEATAEVAVDVITHALGLSIRDTDYRRFPHS
nr:arginase-2, mitochondrial [Ciona intestinalis]|eukprot:XP_002131711.1 arginase-2, mitochondrial [Ciona intestinalis]